MNKTLLVLVILLLCLFGLEALEYTPNQVIVKTNTRGVNFALESSPNLHSWLKGYGVKSIVPLLDRSDNNYYIISTKRDIPLNDIENKRSTFSGVDSIQPNYLNTFHGIVDDPYFLQQQHSLCNISKAWGYTTGDNDIIIAVVDSGILFEHPDLENVIYKNENEIPDNGIDDDNNGYIDDYQGWDFADAPELSTIALGDYTGRDNDASDENYHGTHVSGIIGAETNNGEGIAGVMWNVKILPIRGGFKTTSGGGYLQDDDVSSAIIYATDMGANIINMSWGDSNYSSIIADACQYAYDHGVILVGSSGNDPGPTISYPAKLSTVISVGSVDRDKGLSGFSSYGIDLDIVAPGSEVISTYSIEGDSNGYTTMSGTSMSSPYAAGIIGLLLSYRPDITFDELKTLLYATSEDLGDAGFDIFHGYGLINAENLLASVETPYIAIDYPFENMGVSSSFDIVGTIELDDFFRYSVTYTSEEIPTPLDWYDCETHVNSPEFYDEPITNGVLKRFEVEDEVPDGEYRIRISVQTNSGETYNILKHINIDKTLPYLTEDLYVEKRYRSNIVNYYLKCSFNENVNIVANFYDEDGDEYTSYSSVSDSVIYISFPENLPSGSIDVQLTATNKSGLEYNSGLIEDIGEIDYSSTPINKFSLNQFDTGMIGTKDYYDFDGNGINEFVAMSILDGGFGEVRVLEQSGDSFITKYTFADDFRALDIGNTNDYGMEILGLRLDKLFIYETYEGSNYPLDSYIQEISNAAGGIFADYNGDGEENLLCVINEAAQTVVNLYARQENEFIQRKTLYNTTETNSRNTFVPWLKCARLDSDIYPDIITADKDGDVIIFEIKPGEDDYQVWTTRIPVPNAYYIDYGDITGDGINEFIVGGYVTNQENLNSTHFQFYLFKSDSNDSYYLLDTISFDNVDSNNSLTIVDMNNDGKDEIYLSLTPYLYGIEFVDNKLVPFAVANSNDSFQVNVYKKDEASAPRLICNQIIDDELKAVYLEYRNFEDEPIVPNNYKAVPLNEHSAKLSWISDGISSYNIYKLIDGEVSSIANTTESFYIDSNLESGEEYLYSIATYNSDFSTPESFLAPWKKVIPGELVQIEGIRKISNYSIEVDFSVPVDNDMIHIGHYSLDGGIGNPHSVNLIKNFSTAIIKFDEEFIEPTYNLTCFNMKSRIGVEVEEIEFNFENGADCVAPSVIQIDVLNNKTVNFIFSEDIYSSISDEIQISNFVLKRPTNDFNNSIENISKDGNILTVSLSEKMKYSTQPYKLVIKNIKDVVGNVITIQNSTVQFSLTDIVDLSKLVVYPNPIYLRDSEKEMKFTNFPINTRGKISIFNMAGDLIFNNDIGPFNGNQMYRWDLNNNSGKRVSSGVYIYIIEMEGSRKKGKFAIIH